MMRKLKNIVIGILVAVAFIFAGCSSSNNMTYDKSTDAKIYHSVYSWDRELYEGDPIEVLNQISEYKINRVYQGLYPDDLKYPDETEKLVSALAAEGVEVTYLSGSSSWLSDAKEVEEWTVDLLVQYNKSVSEDAQIHSICLDAEFFTTPGWDDSEHFRQYTDMMKEIADYCHKKGFKLILSAPYSLTDYSSEIYEELIGYVDELSCTAYLVGKEEEIMAPVYEMCKKAGTKFEVVLETQPVNKEYSVTKYNTYDCNGGKTAVLAAAQRLQEEYPDISVGFHSLKFMLTLQ